MDVFEAMAERRSVREYTSQQVDRADLDRILEAGRMSASWANTQCWEIVLVRDSGMKEKLADTLSELVKETSDLQKNADQSLEDFAAGKVEDMHHVMMSMNRADLSFRMMLEVRNKLVEAYTEIMRTQV